MAKYLYYSNEPWYLNKEENNENNRRNQTMFEDLPEVAYQVMEGLERLITFYSASHSINNDGKSFKQSDILEFSNIDRKRLKRHEKDAIDLAISRMGFTKNKARRG